MTGAVTGRDITKMIDEKKLINVGLTAVSRYINETGIGDERHKGKTIPSSGSAAIPSAVVMGGTGRK